MKHVRGGAEQAAEDRQLKVHVALIPLPRDLLFAALKAGKVDLVAAHRRSARSGRTRRLQQPDAYQRLGVVVRARARRRLLAGDLSGREVFVRRTAAITRA